MERNYELVVILDPDLKVEEQEKLVTKIKSFIIKNSKDALSGVKVWGKKNLAYPLKKKETGVYYVFNFSFLSNEIDSLKQKVQLEENILRFLLVEDDKGGK